MIDDLRKRPKPSDPASRSCPSRAERDALIEQFLPLVRHVVARLPVALPRGLDRDDLLGAGTLGLIHAADHFDPTRGASFKTFAYVVIRGAALDEIRRHDPVPRPRRERLRQMDRAADDLREILGRAPTIEEIAERLGVSAAALDEDLGVLHGVRTVSIDDLAGTRDTSPGTPVARERESDPAAAAEFRDQVDALAKAIAALPDPDRKVVVLYHHEGLYLKEIGDLLGVTESRVCQVLGRATRKLRSALQRGD